MVKVDLENLEDLFKSLNKPHDILVSMADVAKFSDSSKLSEFIL